MTKDEADEKVREAKDRALDAARKLHAKSKKGCAFGETFGEMACAELAFRELDRAEAARAALYKPELLRPEAVFVEVDGKYWCVPELVRADRRHILAQAEKLPQYTFNRSREGLPNVQCIALSDLRNLINGGAA